MDNFWLLFIWGLSYNVRTFLGYQKYYTFNLALLTFYSALTFSLGLKKTLAIYPHNYQFYIFLVASILIIAIPILLIVLRFYGKIRTRDIASFKTSPKTVYYENGFYSLLMLLFLELFLDELFNLELRKGSFYFWFRTYLGIIIFVVAVVFFAFYLKKSTDEFYGIKSKNKPVPKSPIHKDVTNQE